MLKTLYRLVIVLLLMAGCDTNNKPIESKKTKNQFDQFLYKKSEGYQ